MNHKFILASSSPRRKELFSKLGVNFKIFKPNIDETVHKNESPFDYVLRMSKEKALKSGADFSSSNIIIAADTIVVIKNKILGKPANYGEAEQMLNLLSGNTHEVLTAFTILRPKKDIMHSEIVRTEVTFNNLARDEIESYIKSKEPMDKAGAYAIQGIGAFMVKKIKGSYENVVGLPIIHLKNALLNLKILK